MKKLVELIFLKVNYFCVFFIFFLFYIKDLRFVGSRNGGGKEIGIECIRI